MSQEIMMSNQFQGRGVAISATAEAESQRAVAEVQAALMVARRFPRDEKQAVDKILNACARDSLASIAMYSYARGGTAITGASINLAKALAQSWGNITFGWRVLNRSAEYSEIEAWAWDLESNVRTPLVFTVKHWRDTKSGGYMLKDERDIYELCANQAARRMRACLLSVIPSDVVDMAIQQCNATVAIKAQATPEKIKAMLEAFAEVNVTKEMLEKHIQRRIDTIEPAQMIKLGKILTSIKDGMSYAKDWFEVAETVEKSSESDINAKLKPQPTPPHDPVTGEIIEANAEAAESVLEGATNDVLYTIETVKNMSSSNAPSANEKAKAILALLEADFGKLELLRELGDAFEATLSKATDAETVAKIRAF